MDKNEYLRQIIELEQKQDFLRNLIEENLDNYEKTKDKQYFEKAKYLSNLQNNLIQEKDIISGKIKPIQSIFKEELLADLTPKFKARQKVIQMPINDFLKLAQPLDKEYSPRAREAYQKGIRWSDLPFLSFDTFDDETQKVYGHEGRHRAKVLQELGYTHMPVELRSRDIRWSEQMNPDSYDYVKSFPKYLMQEGNYRTQKIPFPFTREEAPLPPKSFEQIYKNLTQDSTTKKPPTKNYAIGGLGMLGLGTLTSNPATTDFLDDSGVAPYVKMYQDIDNMNLWGTQQEKKIAEKLLNEVVKTKGVAPVARKFTDFIEPYNKQYLANYGGSAVNATVYQKPNYYKGMQTQDMGSYYNNAQKQRSLYDSFVSSKKK